MVVYFGQGYIEKSILMNCSENDYFCNFTRDVCGPEPELVELATSNTHITRT
jgi:hypothetical protein